MWDDLVAKFEARHGAASMARVKALLHETPEQRKKRPVIQRGAQYVLPGLTQQVIDIDKYPLIARSRDLFKERHGAIQSEFSSYLGRIGRPEPQAAERNLGGEEWRTVYLSRIGREDASVTTFFPRTMDYLKEVSSIIYPIAGIAFSVLEPGAYITPHSDRTNVFIHLHQTVVTPSQCGLRVGNHEIRFQEKESYLFDPSFIHEAWNRSQQNRTHLILPIWHPETTEPEREALAEVFTVLRDHVDGASKY